MPIWTKLMMPEVEQSPTLVMAGYGLHRSQWVNIAFKIHSSHDQW